MSEVGYMCISVRIGLSPSAYWSLARFKVSLLRVRFPPLALFVFVIFVPGSNLIAALYSLCSYTPSVEVIRSPPSPLRHPRVLILMELCRAMDPTEGSMEFAV
jgi:hypothetical protein